MRTGVIRLVAVLPVLATLTVVGSASRVGPSAVGCAQASTAHHAALVIEHSAGGGHGAGPVITVCVAFTEDSVTGAQLLDRSGVQYGSGYSGQAVCQVDHEPAQYQPNCLTASDPYWAMSVSRGGGAWVYSSAGFATQTFRDGDAEGFRYEGQGDGTVPPAPAGVCPVNSAPAPTPAKAPAPASHSAGRQASPTPSRPASAATATGSVQAVAAPGSTTPADSPASHALTAVAGGNRSATLGRGSAGVWAAAALGAVLLVVLAAQLMRVRRRPARRPPP
jgi:hypothetical protein